MRAATIDHLAPLEVGIFARTFSRPTLDGVLDAASDAGFRALHFNFSCAGLASLPEILDDATCLRIRDAFEARELAMVGVSATYNTIHPDRERRAVETARARVVIERCPDLGTGLATLCSGTRDPDDMWTAHPANAEADAWDDLRGTMELLLESAETAGVSLGIEPESANVVASARDARRLIDQVGSDRLRIVLDPANLVTPRTIHNQAEILADAFELLAGDVVQAHAKDVTPDAHVAAGLGLLDYDLYFTLLARHGVTVPMVMHELEESDVPRAKAFVAGHRHRLGIDASSGS